MVRCKWWFPRRLHIWGAFDVNWCLLPPAILVKLLWDKAQTGIKKINSSWNSNVQPGLKSIGLKKDTKPENFSEMQSSVTLSVQVGSGLGDCTTQYWIQDPGSLILWHEAYLLIEKKKKIVKRRKKDICRFCSHFWTLYQDPGASQCGAGWATLPHGVLRNASSGDLVGEGNSLSLEKPAVQLLKLNLQLRRVLGHLLKISTVRWHRALQFTKCFHVHFLPWPLQNICELFQARQRELREFKWL